ncbi:hypothetical protein D3H65_31385 [Paraflavitalea soli]|uniref:Uncharacterized protein n=1 Tax=Paraflavitalea soli TaxID=2315862 RepID=A0A3B7MYC6_9BACT|nr:DUF6702 family protein [Paraflavitalea soli]AXY78229.1 hypothetical protein D3H65_31385 [Paraflavitalea soli]
MVLHLYKWLILCGSLFTGPASQPSSPADLHPLYVSVTEFNHNAADKTLEISCKIFTDDFEKTLATVYNKKVDLFNPKDKAEADRLVSEYVRKRLLVKLDGKDVALEFVGFERENDAVWSYFQAAVPAVPKKVEINNSILYEIYDKQLNLMHVTVGGTRKSTRLNYPDKEAKFEF